MKTEDSLGFGYEQTLQREKTELISRSFTMLCHWATTDLMIRYHNEEWGGPLHDDRGLFEFLITRGCAGRA